MVFHTDILFLKILLRMASTDINFTCVNFEDFLIEIQREQISLKHIFITW